MTVHMYAKLDVNFQDNPKIVGLSYQESELVYVRALALVKRIQSDGIVVDKHLTILTAKCERDRYDVVEDLVRARLWEPVEGGWHIAGWERDNLTKAQLEVQREADRERKRRWREAHSSPTTGNGVTPPSRDAGQQHRATQESLLSEDEDEDEDEPSLREGVQGEGEPAAKRGSRIPEVFTVTDEMYAWAESRCPLVNVERETQRFVNHWKSTTKNAAKLNWTRAWQNWLLKEQSEQERRERPRTRVGGR